MRDKELRDRDSRGVQPSDADFQKDLESLIQSCAKAAMETILEPRIRPYFDGVQTSVQATVAEQSKQRQSVAELRASVTAGFSAVKADQSIWNENTGKRISALAKDQEQRFEALQAQLLESVTSASNSISSKIDAAMEKANRGTRRELRRLLFISALIVVILIMLDVAILRGLPR